MTTKMNLNGTTRKALVAAIAEKFEQKPDKVEELL